MIRRCTNYHCKTSLDEHPIECPHGLPFCEHCVWEEGCSECQLEQMKATNKAIWDAALDGPRPAWTPGQEWADHWAEQAAEEKAYRLAQLEDREEGDRYGAA